MPVPGQRPRVPGGYTVFHWSDGGPEQVIGFADEVRVSSVRPVAEALPIQPMNALRPLEIVTPRAHGVGQIVLVLTDLYNQAVWERLAGLANSRDIIDIFEYVAGLNNGIRVTKYVRTPRYAGGREYSETFQECVVSDVADNESIRIDTMTLNKEITLMYTYSTKNWINRPARPATFR